MKIGLNEKRKILTIIGAACILIAVASGTFYFLQKPGVDLEQLPAQWKKVEDLKLRDGALGAVYQGQGTLERALMDFKHSLEQAGWSFLNDNFQEDHAVATFKKGDQQTVVIAMGRDPKVVVHVLISKFPQEEVKKAELPAQDVAGQDVPDLPRFPGAIMTGYDSSQNNINLEYLARSHLEEVADYYSAVMSEDGWLLQAIETEKETIMISSVKFNRGIATIDIKPDDLFEGYTNITIAFFSSR